MSVHHKLKEAYDSLRKEVLYNILIEFRVSMKPLRLITVCLSEMYSGVRINICWIIFLSKMVYNNETLYHHHFSILFWNMPLGLFKKTRWD
jgi:hypothetical protein